MNYDKKHLRLNEAFQYVDDKFLDLVEQEKRNQKQQQQQKQQQKQQHRKPVWVSLGTAACACLLLALPAVAMAYDWFGLKGLILPQRNEEPAFITFAEYQHRPEAAALMEWLSFLAGYDADGRSLLEGENGGLYAGGRKDWDLYGVTTYEMGEKLDEIAGRYKLILHSERYAVSLRELESMAGGKFMKGSGEGDGILYEDGSFQFDGSAETEEGKTAGFQFRCAVKGSFDDAMPFIWRDDCDEEWQYTAVCGEPLLLVLGDSRALIAADFDECFITVALSCGSESGITGKGLQELADQIDFGMLKDGYAAKLGRDFRVSPQDTVAMSGYPGSPEALACAKWREFLAGYDIDKALEEIGGGIFTVEGREEWELYNVYSYEMGEKLDEIVNAYGLKLHRELNIIDPGEMEYRVGGSFMGEGCTMYWGYIYEDGSFHIEGDARLGGSEEVTDYQFRRVVKGTFDEVTLNIGDVEDYTDWQHLSASGEPVMLSLGHIRSLIFADFEECFIMVNVLAGRNEGMTEEKLQELADKIDFGVLKEVKTPEMRGDSE